MRVRRLERKISSAWTRRLVERLGLPSTDTRISIKWRKNVPTSYLPAHEEGSV